LPFAGPIEYDRLYQAALRRLQNYMNNYGHELVRTIEPEHRFEVPLELARIRGRIDLLLRVEGGGHQDIELVDFKTAANRPLSIQHRNQLRLYAEAARVQGMNPVRLIIHDLDADNGGRIEVEDSKNEVSAFRNELRSWIEDIHERKLSKKRIGIECKSCDFKRFCLPQGEM
jgi:CRISPR/Cas system-associated exonuclease Cas4 (RecB family)